MTLAGLARDTSRIRLGTLVSPVTFRSPGLLAVSVAQVDQMSGGRVELGIGGGWYEAEHTAYGFDFGTQRSRSDRLEDQLAIITGMMRLQQCKRLRAASGRRDSHQRDARIRGQRRFHRCQLGDRRDAVSTKTPRRDIGSEERRTHTGEQQGSFAELRPPWQVAEQRE